MKRCYITTTTILAGIVIEPRLDTGGHDAYSEAVAVGPDIFLVLHFQTATRENSDEDNT